LVSIVGLTESISAECTQPTPLWQKKITVFFPSKIDDSGTPTSIDEEDEDDKPKFTDNTEDKELPPFFEKDDDEENNGSCHMQPGPSICV